ncbi:glycosyl hydrolase, partial [Acinetobacter baumannii]
GTRERSDRFLYDYRRTLADLMAGEHYAMLARVARENGLRVYGEALEDNRPSLGDDMAMRKFADVPMAALWTFSRAGGP